MNRPVIAALGALAALSLWAGAAPAQTPVTLENPPAGARLSGIGLVSGWTCRTGAVEVAFNGGARQRVPGGGARGDTAAVCGRVDTGFGLLVNFNTLGAGTHSAQLFVDGVAAGGPRSFTVVVPSGEFLRGVTKAVDVADFPSPGRTARLEWVEATQNFQIVSVSAAPPAATLTAAEGAWSGRTSTGWVADLIVLDDSRFFSVFGTTVGSAYYLYGFNIGQGTLIGNSLTGTLREYQYTGSVQSGSLSATVARGLSLQGSIAYSGGATSTFQLVPTPPVAYDYSVPASVAAIAGGWNGELLDGALASVSIAGTGAISGSSAGCTFTGSAVPRPSGRNVFNVTLSFGPAPCVAPGATATGYAITYGLSDGRRQILVAVQDTARNLGTLFLAVR